MLSATPEYFKSQSFYGVLFEITFFSQYKLCVWMFLFVLVFGIQKGVFEN